MPFKKGNILGRGRKNKKNKKTIQWEIFSSYCLVGGLKRFQEEIDKLEGKDFIIAFTNLLEFHAPKLARIENTHEGEVTHIIIEKKIISKSV